VATLLGSLDRRGDERWRGNINRFGNAEIDRERDRGSPRDAPFDIDGIVIGRECANGWAWRSRRRADVYVRERRRRGVIEIFRMNMEKGCLNEAQEKGGSTENCARCPHDFLC
jgi:hypothetical protein